MSFRKFVELIGSGEELATLDDTGTLQRRSVVDFRALIGLKIVYVRGASTANIATLSGALTHDGIVYATGDQILLKNQSTANQNGVYLINTAGAWTRSIEHDSSDEIRQRDVVCTADGTTNKMGYAWCCTNTGTITVGTTSIKFAQYPVGIGSGSTQAAAGNHSHTSIATTAASTFGASVGVRYASRTASASTASTDVSVVFSGSTANQVETMPDGTALSNNSGRVIIYSNRASVSWILRQAASNTLNGSSVDYVMPPGSWLLAQNTADNVWQIIGFGQDPSHTHSDMVTIVAGVNGDGLAFLGTTEQDIFTPINISANQASSNGRTLRFRAAVIAYNSSAAATVRFKLNGVTIYSYLFSMAAAGACVFDITVIPASDTQAYIAVTAIRENDVSLISYGFVAGLSFSSVQEMVMTSQGADASSGIGIYLLRAFAE